MLGEVGEFVGADFEFGGVPAVRVASVGSSFSKTREGNRGKREEGRGGEEGITRCYSVSGVS